MIDLELYPQEPEHFLSGNGEKVSGDAHIPSEPSKRVFDTSSSKAESRTSRVSFEEPSSSTSLILRQIYSWISFSTSFAEIEIWDVFLRAFPISPSFLLIRSNLEECPSDSSKGNSRLRVAVSHSSSASTTRKVGLTLSKKMEAAFKELHSFSID